MKKTGSLLVKYVKKKIMNLNTKEFCISSKLNVSLMFASIIANISVLLPRCKARVDKHIKRLLPYYSLIYFHQFYFTEQILSFNKWDEMS